MEEMDARLSDRRNLHGDHVTASDIWLFTTLIRLDSVYGPLFKCLLKRVADFPGLWAFTRRMWADPRVAATVDFERMKRHYFLSLIHTPHGAFELNPTGIVPLGPELDLAASP
ncbi:MAG: glutathione S-transferase C-terminal domain-containing protein [Pseudomonadota bacterium]